MLIDAMDLKTGGTVADVGTGSMLPDLSHTVGDTDHVIGEDIQNDFLDKAWCWMCIITSTIRRYAGTYSR